MFGVRVCGWHHYSKYKSECRKINIQSDVIKIQVLYKKSVEIQTVKSDPNTKLKLIGSVNPIIQKFCSMIVFALFVLPYNLEFKNNFNSKVILIVKLHLAMFVPASTKQCLIKLFITSVINTKTLWQQCYNHSLIPLYSFYNHEKEKIERKILVIFSTLSLSSSPISFKFVNLFLSDL